MNICEKIVLGTVQFGMDYGIANLSGRPLKKEALKIMDFAWQKGIRRFDTAPAYGSETLVGEFIAANGLQEEAIVLTKIPSMGMVSDYESFIKDNLSSSLDNLGCPIDVLFFHDENDSKIFFEQPSLVDNLLNKYPVNKLGVSFYNLQMAKTLVDAPLDLAFQFPFNILDRRFQKIKMPQGMRYARSIFLQGILSSKSDLRSDTPIALLNLQKMYHSTIEKFNLDPINFAVSFVVQSNAMDYFLIGVESEIQLNHILELNLYNQIDKTIFDTMLINADKYWLDPRNWS